MILLHTLLLKHFATLDQFEGFITNEPLSQISPDNAKWLTEHNFCMIKLEHDMWVKLLSMKIFWSESYSFKNTFNFLDFNNWMVCQTLNSLENPSGNP